MKNFSQALNSKGQTMLEVIVIFSVLVLVIGGIVLVITNSLKNSQFSTNQSQATKYAQEAIDKVRTIKAKNCPVRITNGSVEYFWTDLDPLIWDNSVNVENKVFKAHLDATNCFLNEEAAEPIQGGIFQRQISFSDNSDAENKSYIVTVTVSWNDFSGTHESKHVTFLAQ